MDLAKVSRVPERLAAALSARGYSLKDIFRDGLDVESIDRICSASGFTIPDWLRLFYATIDGDRWHDRESELLPIPFYTINPLAQAVEMSKIVAQVGETIPANAVPFCFISSESFSEHFFIDLHEYETGGDGLVYGFGPGFLTEDFKNYVLFDNYISCFEIVASSIEAGISPCNWPGTVDELSRFAQLAASKTAYENNYWKLVQSSN
jgi:hypothetical protein